MDVVRGKTLLQCSIWMFCCIICWQCGCCTSASIHFLTFLCLNERIGSSSGLWCSHRNQIHRHGIEPLFTAEMLQTLQWGLSIMLALPVPLLPLLSYMAVKWWLMYDAVWNLLVCTYSLRGSVLWRHPKVTLYTTTAAEYHFKFCQQIPKCMAGQYCNCSGLWWLSSISSEHKMHLNLMIMSIALQVFGHKGVICIASIQWHFTKKKPKMSNLYDTFFKPPHVLKSILTQRPE